MARKTISGGLVGCELQNALTKRGEPLGVTGLPITFWGGDVDGY
jgi:hypothetical protein